MIAGVPAAHARGAAIPRIGIGTFRLYHDDCTRAVLAAIAFGYRLIDTAARYSNEEAVGAAIAKTPVAREDLWISTKLPLECTAAMVAEEARASLRRLGVDYLDLLLMHWPNKTVPQDETLGAMCVLRDEGLVRWLGVSNFTTVQMEAALKAAPLVTNQIEYHPYLDQSAALGAAARHDLLITAYAPLARGRVLEDPAIGEIARAHGVTAAQATLRWMVQQDRIVTIPKTGTRARLRENIDVFGFELSTQEMRAISALHHGYRIVDPPFAPAWTECMDK